MLHSPSWSASWREAGNDGVERGGTGHAARASPSVGGTMKMEVPGVSDKEDGERQGLGPAMADLVAAEMLPTYVQLGGGIMAVQVGGLEAPHVWVTADEISPTAGYLVCLYAPEAEDGSGTPVEERHGVPTGVVAAVTKDLLDGTNAAPRWTEIADHSGEFERRIADTRARGVVASLRESGEQNGWADLWTLVGHDLADYLVEDLDMEAEEAERALEHGVAW